MIITPVDSFSYAAAAFAALEHCVCLVCRHFRPFRLPSRAKYHLFASQYWTHFDEIYGR